MRMRRSFVLLFLVSVIISDQPPHIIPNLAYVSHPAPDPLVEERGIDDHRDTSESQTIRGGLLSTRFASFEALKKVVQIEYFTVVSSVSLEEMVKITHRSSGREVVSMLKTGVKQGDFSAAQKGGWGKRLDLALRSPYAIIHRKDMQRVYFLAKRIRVKFGVNDVAFFDFAETMFCHISGEDMAQMPARDLTEKGYINTFNHITGQAFMTTLFSEELADYMADAHELDRLPQLVNGRFSLAQVTDLDEGAVDNYVDLVNNEWGQELGKRLTEKYQITRETQWTPELLTDYVNDLQGYYSWAFQISMQPYRASDDVIVLFAHKINRVMEREEAF